MNNRAELKGCPKCGGAIPPEAPQGLCPKCLLLQASFPTETGAQPGSAPPIIEELAKAFSHLEILDLIGQGGMGFVFKARQAKLDRFVALKIMPQSLASEPAFAERFAREGRLLARLNHPNIVTIYDFGQANGFFYLLMEFVDGVNLRQAMKAGRFTPDQALAIVPKICEALQFAHSEGVLHRDIKPENILLDFKGRVKIADFGIAKLIGEPQADSTLTGRGGTLGTLHYMAPEQIEKPAQVDHRADIYSLGVVFYEMLTGELPIGRFAPPSENCGVDRRIDEVVLRALDKKPERRPQSALEVKTQVETIGTQSTQPAPMPACSSPSGRLGRVVGKVQVAQNTGTRMTKGRWALAIIAGAGLALFCVITVTWLIWQSLKQNALPNEARTAATMGVAQGTNALNAVGGEASTNEPFTKTVIFARATNQVIGESGHTWAAGIWSDTLLQPGETISARVRQDNEPMSETGCHSMLFIHSQPQKVGTSASLGWYFGEVWRKDFGEREAKDAAVQLRDNMSERPVELEAGKPLLLFTVTNDSGHVLAGYAEFTRYVPKPRRGSRQSAPKPQAIVNVRRFAAYLPSLDYSVKLPPGYALRPTVNMGSASTHVAAMGAMGDHHSSWYIPIDFRQASASADHPDFPAQLEAQRAALEARFQQLQDLGPIPVILGEPYPVFCLTNEAGQVYRALFELVGPSATGATKDQAAAAPTRSTPRDLTVAARPPVTPQNRVSSTPGPAPARIDPVTGLPIQTSGKTSTVFDPVTGLPIITTLKTPLARWVLTNDATRSTNH